MIRFIFVKQEVADRLVQLGYNFVIEDDRAIFELTNGQAYRFLKWNKEYWYVS